MTGRWLDGRDDASVRAGLAEVAPALVDEALEHVPRTVDPRGDPRWFQGAARLGRAHFVKFAWSAPASARIVREARVLGALAGRVESVPRLVHPPADLACFVTRWVDGETFGFGSAPVGAALRAWADRLAAVLVALHACPPEVVGDGPPGHAMVQTTTGELREAGFLDHLTPAQRPLVERWCAWVDGVLAARVDPVVVHGDLHGHNLRWEPQTAELRLVADFETAGLADPAVDFRYLLTTEPTDGLLRAVLAAYRARGGVVDDERVAAWTVLTVLGDARWRTLAGVPLPGGGTAAGWVDDLARRLPGLGVPT